MTLDQVYYNSEFSFELHATNLEHGQARLWAKRLQILGPGHQEFDLIPTQIMADRYTVYIGHLTSAPEKGWVCTNVYVTVNNWQSERKPLTFYVGERTDWASGIVWFAQPVQEAGPHRQYLGFDPEEPRGPVQGPVFALSVRRSA